MLENFHTMVPNIAKVVDEVLFNFLLRTLTIQPSRKINIFISVLELPMQSFME
jgi:hypothetical protein